MNTLFSLVQTSLIFFIVTAATYFFIDKWSHLPGASKISQFLRKNKSLVTICLLILCSLLAFLFSFIQDDAYISLRYSYNLVKHQSLSWNVSDGPIVQGYTNFIWTIICAIPLAMGLKIEVFSSAFGILLGLCTTIVSFKLCLAATNSRRKAFVATFLLSTNYSFLSYFTGGLETQLVALLVTLSWLIAYKIKTSSSDLGDRVQDG